MSAQTVRLTPHYRSEREPNSNEPCSLEGAGEVRYLAQQLIATKSPEDLAKVKIIQKPRWIYPRKKWSLFLLPSQPFFATKASSGYLFVFDTHVRTYGISQDGEVFVERHYDEIPGNAFLSLHPLTHSGLNKGVIEGELRNMLVQLLQEANTSGI